jgi:hypothetical protein
MSELTLCFKCGKVRKLLYSYFYETCCFNRGEVINGVKPLDRALLKLNEVQNEKSYRRFSKVSKPSSKHTKK